MPRLNLKAILHIILLLLLTRCSNSQKNNNQQVKSDVIKNIEILRSVGFFERYENLTSTAVYESLHAQRVRDYSNMFEKPYDPGMDLNAFQLAEHDPTKLLFIDLEAGVIQGNEVYIMVIEAFRALSNHTFNPTEIQEIWQSETGPITVSFRTKDSLISFQANYQNDWLDERVFETCEHELQKRGIRLVYCLSDDGAGYGQSIAIMRLTEEEQQVLEDQLNWKFLTQ